MIADILHRRKSISRHCIRNFSLSFVQQSHAVAEDIRESYPTDLDQLRILQYDSCRGLEGWIVVNFEFDEFYDYKVESFKRSSEDDSDKEDAAQEYAARWLMIPLTRAIDTLVIHVKSSDHGTPYVIFEMIAALKVSKSLSVQQWSLRPAACAGVLPFNVPCFRHKL